MSDREQVAGLPFGFTYAADQIIHVRIRVEPSQSLDGDLAANAFPAIEDRWHVRIDLPATPHDLVQGDVPPTDMPAGSFICLPDIDEQMGVIILLPLLKGIPIDLMPLFHRHGMLPDQERGSS